MKKESFNQGLFSQLYNKILNPPPEVLQNPEQYKKIHKLKGILPKFPVGKWKVNPGRLQSDPQAVGHVSTEDADNDGIVDTINLNAPRIEEEFRKAKNPLANIQELNSAQLEALSGVMLHEIGHLGGQPNVQVDPDDPEKTFKSEVEADQFALLATNIKNKFDKTGSFDMSLKTIKVLADLANDLDKKGSVGAANIVEGLMEKVAQSAGQLFESDLDSRMQQGAFTKEQPTVPQDKPGTSEADAFFDKYKGKMQKGEEAVRGNVAPKGDPFTYNFNPQDKTFSVATTPRRYEQHIGAVIRDGDKGYDLLKAEALRTGLMKEEAAPQARVAPKQDVGALAAELGLQSIPQDAAQVERMLAGYEESMAQWKGKELTHHNFGSFAKKVLGTLSGQEKAAVGELLERMATAERINPQQALRIWRGAGGLMPDALAPHNEKFQEIYERMGPRWMKLQKLHIAMGGKASEADDGRVNMADDEAEDLQVGEVKEASAENTLNKIATMKEDYQKVFWHTPNRPFNRSNTKFKR
jgi:hypothetical protein